MKKIVYHGTNKDAAMIIMKDGFKSNTYFAFNLADALSFGGQYIFRVVIDFPEEIFDLNWQIRVNEHISPEKIVSLEYFKTVYKIYYNNELREEVFHETQERYMKCQREV